MFPVNAVSETNPIVEEVRSVEKRSISLDLSAIVQPYLEQILSTARIDTPQGRYVGKLAGEWQFRSDHLPMGVQLGDMNIVTWNVLNPAYMDWVLEKDSQGLNGSIISDEHIHLEGSSITLREMNVIEEILSMFEHPVMPKSMVCLQECGAPFLEELSKRLPPEIKIVYSKQGDLDQNVVLYDTRKMRLIDTEINYDAYPNVGQKRAVMNLVFEKDGQRYRVINAHIPGDPKLPGASDFADFVHKNNRADEITIALGDCNFNECEMREAFDKTAGNQFEQFSPYPTNVGLDFVSKDIDHVFIDYGNSSTRAAPLTPEEVLKGLSKTVNLLTSPS